MAGRKKTPKISLTTLEEPVVMELVAKEDNRLILSEKIPAHTTRVYCACWPGFYTHANGVITLANITMRIRGFVKNMTLRHDPRHMTYQWIAMPTQLVATNYDTPHIIIRHECTAPSLRTLATASVRAFALQRSLRPGDLPATLHAEVMDIDELHYPMPLPGLAWEWIPCPFIEPPSTL